MSRLPDPANGYVNGDHGGNIGSQYHPTYREDGSAEGRRDLRPGGYGDSESGKGNPALPHDSDGPTSSTIEERSGGIDVGYSTFRNGSNTRNQTGGHYTDRDGDREGGQSASRTYGSGPGGRQIEGRHRISF